MINGLCSRKDRSQTLAVMDQGIEEVEGARPNTAIESNRPRAQALGRLYFMFLDVSQAGCIKYLLATSNNPRMVKSIKRVPKSYQPN